MMTEKESKRYNTKQFYKKIYEDKKTEKDNVRTMKNKLGKTTENEKYKEVWVEYFIELLPNKNTGN